MKTLIKPSVHRWANWSHYLHSEKNSIEGHRSARRGRLARAHSNDEIWFVWRQRKQSRQLTSLVDDFIASKAAAAHWNRTRTHRGSSWNDVIAERFSVWAAVCDLLWDVTQKELIKCPFFFSVFFLCVLIVWWMTQLLGKSRMRHPEHELTHNDLGKHNFIHPHFICLLWLTAVIFTATLAVSHACKERQLLVDLFAGRPAGQVLAAAELQRSITRCFYQCLIAGLCLFSDGIPAGKDLVIKADRCS